MTDRIYLSPPDVGEAECDALVRALRSGWVAPLGPEVDAFEAELSTLCGRQHCVALSSGTAALHLGLLTLGVSPGDVVVTSTLTFAATVNAVIYTGAEPVFVDVEPSGNLKIDLLEKALTELIGEGRRIGAIVPVDLLGKVADQEGVTELAERFGVPALSDAAESLGATRNGHPAASFGTAAAVSFNGNKVMTTSGGGALVTDDEALASRVRYLSTQARQPVPYYEHTEVGYNYRLSNLLAALGRAQLARLPGFLERRRDNRRFYRELLADVPGVTPFGDPYVDEATDTADNCWLTSILIDEAVIPGGADAVRRRLEADNIEARPLWKPMHAQPAFRSYRGYIDGTADALFAQGLSLPSGSALTDADRDRVGSAVLQAVGSR